jgi:hypothetical protein
MEQYDFAIVAMPQDESSVVMKVPAHPPLAFALLPSLLIERSVLSVRHCKRRESGRRCVRHVRRRVLVSDVFRRHRLHHVSEQRAVHAGRRLQRLEHVRHVQCQSAVGARYRPTHLHLTTDDRTLTNGICCCVCQVRPQWMLLLSFTTQRSEPTVRATSHLTALLSPSCTWPCLIAVDGCAQAQCRVTFRCSLHSTHWRKSLELARHPAPPGSSDR